MADTDRIFNSHGRRHYRRTYSLLEVRIGVAILGGLIAVGAWVGYRGARPDPSLLATGVELTERAEPVVDRGPIPTELVTADYREGRVRSFGPDNLFEKINGRADFFKSRGFAQLSTVTLQHSDPNRSIDVEIYDMGSGDNAQGTYASERSADVTPTRANGSQFHTEPNALFMARGRYYVRATAATGQAPVPEQLGHLRARLTATVAAAERPWSEALFVDGLSLPAEALAFVTENGFSFGFARGLHTATLADGETQLFVMPATDETAAEALAVRFAEEGFGSYGEATRSDGTVFVTDRYLKRVSVATASGRFVIGVASAADQPAAASELARLKMALSALPDADKARAVPARDPGSDEAADTAPPKESSYE